jgi:hypothetical protein
MSTQIHKRFYFYAYIYKRTHRYIYSYLFSSFVSHTYICVYLLIDKISLYISIWLIAIKVWEHFRIFYWQVLGITQSMHHGQQAQGTFADLLDRWYSGVPNGGRWREAYGLQWTGPYWAGLRGCLLNIGIQGWMEILCGRSYSGYRCLDLYTRHVSSRVIQPKSDAWYVLNSEPPAAYRREPLPEDWFHYHKWVSYGQKMANPEYDFESLVVALRARL